MFYYHNKQFKAYSEWHSGIPKNKDSFLLKSNISSAKCHPSVIPALSRLRQKNCHKFRGRLNYTVKFYLKINK